MENEELVRVNDPVYTSLLRRLEAQRVPFVIHEHPPLYTFADAQANLAFPLGRLLKTIAFRLKAGGRVLAALRGQDRVSYRDLAAALGIKRTEIFPLSPEEVREIFSVEAGSVGPLLAREGVQVIFDTQVPVNETVFCGIGRPDRTLEILLMDLVQVTQGQIQPLATRSAAIDEGGNGGVR